MTGIIISSEQALPRDIDVGVNVSKAATESTTDLSILGFMTPDAPFSHDADRVHFYSTLGAVQDDFAASSEAVKAATAFFSQTPRAKTFAVGKIFEQDQPGFLQCGPLGKKTLSEWKAVTNGTFKIGYNGVYEDVMVDFSSINEFEDISIAINAALDTISVAITCEWRENGLRFVGDITQIPVANGSVVSKLQPTGNGLDICGSNWLNGAEIIGSEVQPAYCVPGYSVFTEDEDGKKIWNLQDEVNYVRQAAAANGKFIYAWTMDAKYRDSDDQLEVARIIEAQTYGVLGLVTNSPLAKSASSVSDIGALVKKNGYRRTFCVYHNNAFYYPEVSILAYALSVDYSMQDSTITTKFKTLQGIPTVPITESELSVLTDKRINTYTSVGNDARTYREGVEGDSNWYLDDLINLDNFREELQVSVYNVFTQNKKVPYNQIGVNMITLAITQICDKYVFNGTLSARALSEAEVRVKGYTTDPAYTVTVTPLQNMTVSQRAKRIGPPAKITLNLAGAIHSIELGVEAFA